MQTVHLSTGQKSSNSSVFGDILQVKIWFVSAFRFSLCTGFMQFICWCLDFFNVFGFYFHILHHCHDWNINSLYSFCNFEQYLNLSYWYRFFILHIYRWIIINCQKSNNILDLNKICNFSAALSNRLRARKSTLIKCLFPDFNLYT